MIPSGTDIVFVRNRRHRCGVMLARKEVIGMAVKKKAVVKKPAAKKPAKKVAKKK